MVLEPLVYARHKFLCTDDAAVRKVPGPISEAIQAVKFETCPLQFTCDRGLGVRSCIVNKGDWKSVQVSCCLIFGH